MQLEDWLDDLCVRFIINLPPEELQSVERICFQVEEAQWFYEDFIRPLNPSLPSLTLRAFSLRIFQHCPLFSQWSAQHHTTAFAEFLAYKSRVPVRGAIMLNEAMDEVVLVKGWKKGANWSFPRGKINKDEGDLDCAVREVYEETGFDIRAAGLVKDEKDMKYIEVTMREQHMRLYVFRGVPRDAHFEPKTRKEISKIEWYKLTDLPTLKKNRQQEGSGTDQPTMNANKFYMVAPFLNPLKKWIAQQRKKENRYSSHLAAPPMVPEEVTTEDDQDINGVSATLPLPLHTVSDLPEVTAADRFDPTSHLKQILNIGTVQPVQGEDIPQASHMQHVDAQKSNALLALLRNPQQGQNRPIPQTPLEQITTVPPPQQSPHVSHVRQSQMDQNRPPPLFQPPVHQSSRDTEPPTTTSPKTSQWHPPQLQSAPYQRTGDPQFALQGKDKALQPIVPPASALPKLTNHTKALLDVFKGTGNMAPAPPPPESSKKGLLELLTGGGSLAKAAQPSPGAIGSDLANLAHRTQNSNFAQSTIGQGPQPTFEQRVLHQHPAISPRVPPTQTHKTSLLDLLTKGNQAGQAVEVKLANQLPAELAATRIKSPSGHEIDGNKNELLLSLLSKGHQDRTTQARPVKQTLVKQGETSATINGPLNQPEFEAISRASRQMSSDMRRSPLTSHRTLYDPNQPVPMKILTRSDEARQQQQSTPPRSPRTMKPPPKRAAKEKVSHKPSNKPSNKPFQPQILRRPQTADSSEPESTASKTRNQEAVQTNAVSSPSTPDNLTVQERPPVSRQSSQSTSQKQALLSLFSGGIETTPKASAVPPASGLVSPLSASQLMNPNSEGLPHGIDPISTRTSRVGSLASITGGPVANRATSEKRQTGAENKAFLLGYLGRIASQESQE
ncbi:hypothetical protein PV08_09240 [Exophiala spinifera]|uniref:Nudix hydrolase domain-containing protein n=1 Tax=Exophiala spinifera TaxID=91928 RepID=A0A0D1YAL5_9EURO|nr:uncharacterized protein PV08_09240 [Exophiala spinifera]KIW11966.1 hypothetical protein PV08_09240 [Exophiala spinifera]